MKTNNILLILIILSFAGAVWLITENHALKTREIDMMDKWFPSHDPNTSHQLTAQSYSFGFSYQISPFAYYPDLLPC